LCAHFGDRQTNRQTDGQRRCLKSLDRYRERRLENRTARAIACMLSVSKCLPTQRMDPPWVDKMAYEIQLSEDILV